MVKKSKRHLYTIWNPKHDQKTIIEHRKVLDDHDEVKWLVLYDKETEKNYRDTLSDKIIEKINEEAKKEETVLFIQCLNIFKEPLWIGRIKTVERISKTKIDHHDPNIPQYYHEALSKFDLEVSYSITLCDLDETELDKILDLKPAPKFQSAKFNYPFPCVVYQSPYQKFFEIPPGASVVIVKSKREKTKWYVKRPKNYDRKKQLSFSKYDIALLRLFTRTKSMTAENVALNLIESYNKSQITPPNSLISNKMSDRKGYVYNRIKRINDKFSNYYKNKQLKLIDSQNQKYIIQTKELRIE